MIEFKPGETAVRVAETVEFQPGGSLDIRRVGPFTSDAAGQPNGLVDWAFFNGAVLAISIATAEGIRVVGTACMIAPGLAVTAHHVFADITVDLSEGRAALACIGIGANGGEFWNVTGISFGTYQEIAYLCIARASDMGEKPSVHVFPITLRPPQVGEIVTLIGFRMPKVTRSGDMDVEFLVEGDLYLASGPVQAVYPNGRDAVLMPFPAITVDCASLGGMSGGAVVDQHGCLLGVTSTGMESSDGGGPSNAAWILGGLRYRLNIAWPRGLYPPELALLELDERLVTINERSRVSLTDEGIAELRLSGGEVFSGKST